MQLFQLYIVMFSTLIWHIVWVSVEGIHCTLITHRSQILEAILVGQLVGKIIVNAPTEAYQK